MIVYFAFRLIEYINSTENPKELYVWIVIVSVAICVNNSNNVSFNNGTSTVQKTPEETWHSVPISVNNSKNVSFNNGTSNCDCPETWQTFLPDPASSIMEGLLIFNNHLLFVIVTIIILIGWFLANTIEEFGNFFNSSRESFFHNSLLEIIWTTTPALILWSLASPSFSLLYSMDEIADPSITLKILGHQWYWSYETSDFNTCKKDFKSLKFTSYMLSKDELRADNRKGFFRVLETGKRIIMPTNTHIRLLVTATDVLHSWTIPSLGLKVDACPGRLNQLNVFIKRLGVFFGQCSEICGTNHGFMPIVLLSLNSSQYHFLMMTNLQSQ